MTKKINQVPFGITIFIALVIFYVSGITFPPSNEIGALEITTTLYHMSIFFFFAIFLFLSFPQLAKNKKLFAILSPIVVVYAGLDEFHQSFVPGRLTSMGDFLIDCIGMAFAVLVYLVYLQIKKFRLSRQLNRIVKLK
jgi:VanZ family protein